MRSRFSVPIAGATSGDRPLEGERSERMTCPGCHVGINTNRRANAAEEIQKAIEKVPSEITIKFFR